MASNGNTYVQNDGLFYKNIHKEKVVRILYIIISLIIFIAVYGGGNYYIAGRLYQFLSYPFPHINLKAYIGIIVFIASSIILGILPFPVEAKRILQFIGAFWLGISLYLALLFLAADIIILL